MKTGEPKVKHTKKGGNTNYWTVNLYVAPKVPKWERQGVHRLIAEAFLPDWNPKLQVNHINGNGKDNRVSNLEMVTKSQNMQHALKTGLSSCLGETHHKAKLTEKEVHEICQLLIETDLFEKEIAEIFGVSRQAISNISSKHRWKRISDQYWEGKVHRLSNRNRDKRKSKVS